MRIPVLYEQITERGFPVGWYYAHLPTLGLTTHGQGIEGARIAALDLAEVWLAEKAAHGESPSPPGETLLATLDVTCHAPEST